MSSRRTTNVLLLLTLAALSALLLRPYPFNLIAPANAAVGGQMVYGCSSSYTAGAPGDCTPIPIRVDYRGFLIVISTQAH